MTIRCPECGAGLRVDESRIGSRTHGRCARCGGSVPLTAKKPDEQERITLSCRVCNAKLKAPPSSSGRTSQCPRCGATVRIAPAASLDTVATAQREGMEAIGAATQRIDSRSLGFGTMARRESDDAPPGMDRDQVDFLASEGTTPRAGPGTPSVSDHPGRATLLETPVEPMVAATETVLEGVRMMQEDPRPQPGPHPNKPMTHRDQTSRPASERQSGAGPENGPRPRQAVVPEDGARPVTKPRARPTAAPQPATRFPVGIALLSGAVAGGAVAAARIGIMTFYPGADMGLLLAPMPAWVTSVGLPLAAVITGLLTIGGSLVGFLAALTTRKGNSSRLGFLRCSLWGAFGGILMGSTWALGFDRGFDLPTLSLALNWVRDITLVGLLTSAVSRLMLPDGA